MKIIDTHCHLDHSKFDEDLDDVIESAKINGICSIIIPGADPLDLPKAQKIAQKYENLFYAAGVHPYECQKYDRNFLEQFLDDPKCIAIGECGLDYYRLPQEENEKNIEKRLQKEVFIDQIELAKKYKKPLIVHIREATEDSKNILLSNNAKEVGGVFHCFNASDILLDMAQFGFYFGIGGVVTFKNAKKLIEILPKIAIDKIILETDAPYLTPEPNRGKRNEPVFTIDIAKKVSEVLKIEQNLLEKICYDNSIRLFKELVKVC